MNNSQIITRNHRTAFVLMLDLSMSMSEYVDYDNSSTLKSEVLSKVSNRLLQELQMRAMRCDGVRNYYDVAIIGYSGDSICSLLNGDIDAPFLPISSLKESGEWIKIDALHSCSKISKSDKSGERAIEIATQGSTPTYEALLSLGEILDRWCSDNPTAYPPMVYNIGDGRPSDCNLEQMVAMADRVKSISTNDGNVMLVNIHLECEEHGSKLIFPTDDECANHPSRYVKELGRASSILPESLKPIVQELRDYDPELEYRALAYNSSVVDLISMLIIGTQSVTIK